MLPEFANPAGLWALLGVPAVLAIHFLQQRSRTAVVSTLFLIEHLAPESRGGRTWERLRSSRPLWLQLLAVALAAWVLGEPRWVRSDSAQTIALVLDDSASMGAFRAEAARAAGVVLAGQDGRAGRTEWLVLTSDPRTPVLYRGADRGAAEAAVAAWSPARGTHDPQPALRLAHALAGPNGLTWFITDARAKVPAAQAAVGVGRPLENVGFGGASVQREDGAMVWRALLQNHSDRPQRRRWWVEAGGGRTAERTAELAPGGLLELSGRLPDGVDRCLIALEPDAFAADDRLPLARPAAKPLPARVEIEGEVGAFFRRALGTVEGVHFAPGTPPRLRVLRLAADRARPAGAAIILPPVPARADRARVLRAPVVTARHPLLADLNWQGWLGPGPGSLATADGDTPLLWQAERPLAWLSAAGAESRALVLNFDWEVSNADRLPAAVLLVRRHAETVRDAQPGPYAANFDALAPVPLAASELAGGGPFVLEVQAAAEGARPAARNLDAAELPSLRAPADPGFFVLRRGEEVLVRGAAQFADPRQSDFRRAETFVTGSPAESDALFRRNSRPDPFVPLWLALVGVALVGSWWPGRRATSAAPAARAPAPAKEAA
ncbi:MAG TPA: BatA domain-containing protein [Opitutaceae bacterium]|nr:BatA domain-containing protein [Opitutaceae bacterium]